jgi:hypothetical protein
MGPGFDTRRPFPKRDVETALLIQPLSLAVASMAPFHSSDIATSPTDTSEKHLHPGIAASVRVRYAPEAVAESDPSRSRHDGANKNAHQLN